MTIYLAINLVFFLFFGIIWKTNDVLNTLIKVFFILMFIVTLFFLLNHVGVVVVGNMKLV